MSSHEIAELTGKQHGHVIRDIRKMIEDMAEDDPKMGHQKNQGVTAITDVRGYTSMFMLDKRMSQFHKPTDNPPVTHGNPVGLVARQSMGHGRPIVVRLRYDHHATQIRPDPGRGGNATVTRL